MKNKILDFLQDKRIYYPTFNIRIKQLDFRPFYICYPYSVWGWKWELEKYHPNTTMRKLSALEINFPKWHQYVDFKYRRVNNVFDYCYHCYETISEQVTSDGNDLCKDCKEIYEGSK